MTDLGRIFRRVGWIFLAIAVNIVVIGVGALWLEAGQAGIEALFDPANAWIWLTTALTFAPAVGSFYASWLFNRRSAE
ncbi:hypothetical protein GH984_09590 [Spiribacter sp. C176]|uniref:Uncharacterized protein n=1 Tax=Spiribacter salilacus TaxID=2664894 RepID=A0A6N7QR82_9GAMM|nr:hypothetical protein [Spiribacter salilacus]MRH78951.1 hypothetical protein [Spiribacter salilacus]